jgi:hypothetical protein
MRLLDILPSENTDLFDEGLRNMLIAHFPWIKENNYYDATPVSAVTTEIYRGDFHGLLKSLGVAPANWQLFTLFNGYKCSTDFKGLGDDIVLLPQLRYISQLTDIYQTKI